jgi:hypothetical protein
VLSLLVIVAIGGWGLHRWMSEDRRAFLPGQTSHAHYQIEIRCNVCHTPFEGVKQESCLKCHGDRLRAANDTHPVEKFAKPTGPHAAKELDATRCITCHKEHAPQITRAGAVSQPADFCVHCHVGIGKERPSHQAFAFTTCATSGCHNYHDNLALREDALAPHRGEPAVLPRPVIALNRERQFAVNRQAAPGLIPEQEGSAHARADVNCPKCHEVRNTTAGTPQWNHRPGPPECVTCHEPEVQGFLGSRHGMRWLQNLSPMTPAMARLPMNPAAHHRNVTCASCHDAHLFDTRPAPVQACLACHDDDHTRAYLTSPHGKLWRAEASGQAAPGTGVSCATCHLPRIVHERDGRKRVITQHNQSETLRPSSRMLGAVCLSCHGLAFAIDALADKELARRNYAGQPSRHVESIDMVDAKLRAGPKTQ